MTDTFKSQLRLFLQIANSLIPVNIQMLDYYITVLLYETKRFWFHDIFNSVHLTSR